MTILVRATVGADTTHHRTHSFITHDQNSGTYKFEEELGTLKSTMHYKVGKVFLSMRRKLGLTEEPSIKVFQQSNSHAVFFGIAGEPIRLEWNTFPRLTSWEMLQNAHKVCKVKVLNQKDSEIE